MTASPAAPKPGAPDRGKDVALSRLRLLGIIAAIGSISAVGISLSLGLPLLAMVLEDRGYSSSAIGINTAMAGVSAVLFTPFVPRLAARFGAAQLLAASVLIAMATFPLFYVFESFWVWFPLRFVFHGAINSAFVLSEYWINALAPDGRRGLFMGIYATVLSVGFAVGPAILGLVGATGPAPFVVGTLVLGLAAIPVLAAFAANPPMTGGSGHSFMRHLTLVPLATFAALVMGATESGMFSFAAIYGLRIGLPEATAALLVSAVVIGNVVSQIPLGMISDRMDRRLLLLIIAGIGTVLIAIVPLIADRPFVLFTTLAVWGGVVAGLYTVGLTHLGARLSGADLASANAAFVFMYSLGMLFGPATMGAGMDLWNPHGLTTVAALFLGGYAVLAAWRLMRGSEA